MEVCIKHLAGGNNQDVTLVVHPKYGKVVRKVPKKDLNEKQLLKLENEYKVWRYLRYLGRKIKDSQFVNIIGREGFAFFFEYSKPTQEDLDLIRRYENKEQLDNMEARDKINDSTMTLINRISKKFMIDDLHRLNFIGNKFVDFAVI